jgi:HEAT repeats
MDWNNKGENVARPPCGEWEPLVILSVAGELGASEQARVNEHVANCLACSAALAREKELIAAAAEHCPEPDAALLASCRASLEDALDREEERGWLRRFISPLLPSNWLSPSPAWSAAVLLAIGFTVGVLGPRLLIRAARVHGLGRSSSATSNRPTELPPGMIEASTSSPSSIPSVLDLHHADVAGISVLPSGGDAPAEVELRLNGQQPAMVRGTTDDDLMKSMLLDVVRRNDPVDPSVCLSALDVLHSCNNDPEVRAALCRVARTNRNPEVRLRALQALDGSEPEGIFRETLLDALAGDQSPRVRGEAINELLGLAESGQVIPDDQMLSVLHNRVQNDPDRYVRAQSAAIIRKISAKP